MVRGTVPKGVQEALPTTFRLGQVPRPSPTTEASGLPGRGAVSRPIRPTKRQKLPWLHEAGESSSSEEDETSAAAGCLRAPDPGSSRLDLDSAHPPPNPENAFIHCKVSKSVSQWTQEDLYRWYEEEDRKPHDGPHEWYHWLDSRPDEPFDQTVLTRQMERWQVRCAVCLLLQEAGCHSHGMSRCPRDEGHHAYSMRQRLWGVIEDVEDDGIKGYGEAPWCIYCHLPRSRCPAWSRDGQDGDGYGDDEKGEENQWRLTDASRCEFGRTIGDAIAAILGLNGGQFGGFWDMVVDWRDESEIRYNEGRDVYGWLASPMRWGNNEVMVMTRVFHQLDKAVEEMWMRKMIDARRIELGAMESWEWLAQRPKAKRNATKRKRTRGWADEATEFSGEDDLAAPEGRRVEADVSSEEIPIPGAGGRRDGGGVA
jgi:hypothetical protein